MRIPRYWAHGAAEGLDRNGKPARFTCWHWSERSYEEARSRADARAAELLNQVVFGAAHELGAYPYGVRPMREEIVEVLTGRKGAETAIITRNGYGALVLNAARAMFMDIDLEEEKKAGRGFFARLFKTKPPRPPRDEPGLDDVRRWAERHRDLSLRVYRTRAGLRCLVTNQTFDPTDPAAEALMRELNCDPLYVRLCRQQACFRARLTPKPWRCDMANPPLTFPFETPELERKYRKWERDYERASANFTVCRLLETIGTEVHPEIEPTLSLHDKYCLGDDRLELA